MFIKPVCFTLNKANSNEEKIVQNRKQSDDLFWWLPLLLPKTSQICYLQEEKKTNACLVRFDQ